MPYRKLKYKKGEVYRQSISPLDIRDPLLGAGLPTMAPVKRSRTVLRNPEGVRVKRLGR